ncbi:protein Wnt-7b isoform X8 [Nematostella vectensis]|uniref:protein Wnt-7b isoform X8 n=1 Tax=Nematostella vectensis TaxID=45351 RepID=UPI00207733D0|nr:protein Wnt-7b isoform X8 [Nematostella vectensis]
MAKWCFATFIRLTLISFSVQNALETGSKKLFVDSVAIPPSIICTRIQPLSAKQMRFCEDKPGTMVSISQGYDLGVEECKYQFRNKRWNCSLLGEERPFGQRAVPGTKEAAFTHAIISAGIVQAVTLACTQNPTGCGCDRNKDGISREGWKWGGCSVNIGHGLAVAKEFLNANDAVRSDIALMNRHNNEVGREVVNRSLLTECTCHGPSASCVTRTCSQALPSPRAVSNRLKALYDTARRATVYLSSLVRPDDKVEKVKPMDLAYLKDSPNYCTKNTLSKLPGTLGRNCKISDDSQEEENCDVMCCGRGYDTHLITKRWQCRCKFVWCCNVRCSTCSKRDIVQTCK